MTSRSGLGPTLRSSRLIMNKKLYVRLFNVHASNMHGNNPLLPRLNSCTLQCSVLSFVRVHAHDTINNNLRMLINVIKKKQLN